MSNYNKSTLKNSVHKSHSEDLRCIFNQLATNFFFKATNNYLR